MKILLVNKYFFSFGGTETAFFRAARLLADLGHEVIQFSMDHPKNLASRQSRHFASQVDLSGTGGWRAKARAVKRILFGHDAQTKLEELLRVERPDVAHLHNIYHHLSPAIIATLKKHGIPVVLTLHDYKTVCPAYKLFRAGSICEECRGARFRRCLTKRCIQRSRLKSLVCYLEARRHRKNYRRVDRFVCPSRFLMAKVREMGLPGRFTCIANFVKLAPFSPPEPPSQPRVLFFGRLVEEKGVAGLIAAMKGLPADCLIVGDGPEKEALQALAAQSPEARVRFLGHQPLPDLEAIIRSSSLVVVPSIWYENNPFAIIEAFALGVPVVAARIGGIPEMVIDRETGLLFTAGDSAGLRAAVAQLLERPELGRELARRARRHLERHFSAEQHGEKLLGLYRELLAASDLSAGDADR